MFVGDRETKAVRLKRRGRWLHRLAKQEGGALGRMVLSGDLVLASAPASRPRELDRDIRMFAAWVQLRGAGETPTTADARIADAMDRDESGVRKARQRVEELLRGIK